MRAMHMNTDRNDPPRKTTAPKRPSEISPQKSIQIHASDSTSDVSAVPSSLSIWRSSPSRVFHTARVRLSHTRPTLTPRSGHSVPRVARLTQRLLLSGVRLSIALRLLARLEQAVEATAGTRGRLLPGGQLLRRRRQQRGRRRRRRRRGQQAARRRARLLESVLRAHVDAQVPGGAVDVAALGTLGRAEVGGPVAAQVDRRLVAAAAHVTRAPRT